VTGGITGCIIYSANNQTLEALPALRRNLPCKIIELNNNIRSRGDLDFARFSIVSRTFQNCAPFFTATATIILPREKGEEYLSANNKHRWKFLDKLNPFFARV